METGIMVIVGITATVQDMAIVVTKVIKAIMGRANQVMIMETVKTTVNPIMLILISASMMHAELL